MKIFTQLQAMAAPAGRLVAKGDADGTAIFVALQDAQASVVSLMGAAAAAPAAPVAPVAEPAAAKKRAPRAKKDDAEKRVGSWWAAWTKHSMVEYKSDFAEWSAQMKEAGEKPLAPSFAKYCKEMYEADCDEFKMRFAAGTLSAATVTGAVVVTPAKKASAAVAVASVPPAPKKIKKVKVAVPAPVVVPSVAEIFDEDSEEDADAESADGAVAWEFRGKTYWRTADNECWLSTKSGGRGEWAGVYDPTTDKIDDSVPEPEID